MLFFSARCECFGNAASSQRKEFPKRPSSVFQTFHRNGSIPRNMSNGRYDDHRCYQKVTVQSAGLHCNSATCRSAHDAWQSCQNTLHEDGITEHTAHDVRLDTIIAIEANISKYPCS